MANMLGKFTSEMSSAVLQIVIYALLIGSILGSAAFAGITIINVTSLSATYGAAIVALVALLTVAATIVGLLFFWGYAKKIIGKKGGMDMTA